MEWYSFLLPEDVPGSHSFQFFDDELVQGDFNPRKY